MSAVRTAAATSIQVWWKSRSRRLSARNVQNSSDTKETRDYVSAGDMTLRRTDRPMWRASGFPGTAERLHGHLMVHMRQVLDMVAVQAACRAVSSTSYVVGAHSAVARSTVSGAEAEARDAIHVGERFGFQLINAKWLACHVVATTMASVTARREQELTALSAAGSTYAAEYWALGCAALFSAGVQLACEQLSVMTAEAEARAGLERQVTLDIAAMTDQFRIDGLRIVAAEFVHNMFSNAGRNLKMKHLQLEEAAARDAISDSYASDTNGLREFFNTSTLHLRATTVTRGLLYISSLVAWFSKMQFAITSRQERGRNELQAEETGIRHVVSTKLFEDEEACLRLNATQCECNDRQELEENWLQCEEAACRCGALSQEQMQRTKLLSHFEDFIAEAQTRWNTARVVVNEAVESVISLIEERDAVALAEEEPRAELFKNEERRRADILVEWYACQRQSACRTSAASTIASAARQFLSKRLLGLRVGGLHVANDARVVAECHGDWMVEKHDANQFVWNEHRLTVAHAHGLLKMFTDAVAARAHVAEQHRQELHAIARCEEEVKDLVAAIVSGAVALSDRSSALELEASQARESIVVGEIAEFENLGARHATDRAALLASTAATAIQQVARRWLSVGRVRSMTHLVQLALLVNDEAASRQALAMATVEEAAALEKHWAWYADSRALAQLRVHFAEGVEIITLNGAARTLQRIARGVHARARVRASQRRLYVRLLEQEEACERDEVGSAEGTLRRTLEHLDTDSLLQADEGMARRALLHSEQAHRMWITGARIESLEESARFHLQRATLEQLAGIGNRVRSELSYTLKLQAAARSQLSRLVALRKQDEQRTLDPSTSSVFGDETWSRLGVFVAEAEARLSLQVPWLAFSVASGQMRPTSVVASMDEMRCAARGMAGDLKTRLAYARSTQRQRSAFHLLDVGYRRYVSRTDVVTAVASAHSADIAVGVDFVDFVEVAAEINPEQFAFATQRTQDRLPPAAREPYARFLSNADDCARELAVALCPARLKDLADEVGLARDPAANSIVRLWMSMISPCSSPDLAPAVLAAQCATAAGRMRLISETLRVTWMDVSDDHVDTIHQMRQAALRNCDLRRENTMLLQDIKRWMTGLSDVSRLFTPQYAAASLSVPARPATPSQSRPSTAPRPASPASPTWQEVPSPMVVHKPVPPTAAAPAVHRRLAW